MSPSLERGHSAWHWGPADGESVPDFQVGHCHHTGTLWTQEAEEGRSWGDESRGLIMALKVGGPGKWVPPEAEKTRKWILP